MLAFGRRDEFFLSHGLGGKVCAEGENSKFHPDSIYSGLTEVLFPEVYEIYREIWDQAGFHRVKVYTNTVSGLVDG